MAENQNCGIERYSEFWLSNKYFLFDQGDGGYLIMEKSTGGTELIEDAKVYYSVIRRMKQASVPILTELPKEAKEYQDNLLSLIDSGASAAEVNCFIKEFRNRRPGKGEGKADS